MSVGNYFSTKTDNENFEKHKAIEYWEIENLRADADGKFRIIFETLDQLLIVKSKPKKKIGFTVKEKKARYGKHGNRKNDRKA